MPSGVLFVHNNFPAQFRDLAETLDLLFDAFGQMRFSAEWPKQLAKMQRWLSREERKAA